MGQIGQQQFLELIWFYGSYIVFLGPQINGMVSRSFYDPPLYRPCARPMFDFMGFMLLRQNWMPWGLLW